jgi:arsenite-transporting ATPase
MFAGKGGVGKTTCAAATALHHALNGEKTLVISTDPTPSLSHIFEVKEKQKPVKVLDNLYLAELGQTEVKQMWDKKFGREVYEVFSSFVAVNYTDFVDFMSSILPGLSDEFMVDYIKELSKSGEYEQIVWDTAPLGQTLGLLKTPGMLREHLKPAPRIYSQLKLGSETKRPVLEILKGWEKLSKADMEFLKRDVAFILVTIPEALAVEQLDGILEEMAKNGFQAGQLIINNIIREIGDSSFLKEKASQQRAYLEFVKRKYSQMQIVEIQLFPHEIKGIEQLKQVERCLFGEK